MGRAVHSAKATRDVMSPPPYHRARGCRVECGASPPHRGHPRSWVGGLSSCGSSGIGPPHSSGHTRTRDSNVTSLQALCGKEKGHMKDPVQTEPPPPMYQEPGAGSRAKTEAHRGTWGQGRACAGSHQPFSPGQARGLQKRRSW